MEREFLTVERNDSGSIIWSHLQEDQIAENDINICVISILMTRVGFFVQQLWHGSGLGRSLTRSLCSATIATRHSLKSIENCYQKIATRHSFEKYKKLHGDKKRATSDHAEPDRNSKNTNNQEKILFFISTCAKLSFWVNYIS